ncbi:MAG TPA: hypothetical protein DCY94_01680 [Firmicutes bacterium]|nr:hypothetical protein [Bacillota bacterium]
MIKLKQLKRIASIILGCLLIAVPLNIFYKTNDLIPSGMFGFAIMYNDKANMDLSLIILLMNIFFLVLGFLLIDKKRLKKMIIPFALIPLFVFLTKNFTQLIDFTEVDKLLLALYGGVITGFGFRFIYKNDAYASGSDVIMLITKEIDNSKRNLVNYIIDGLWICIAVKMYGFEGAMYSAISIIIMEVLSKRATLGVSDAKVFYIITKFDKEIREYIIDELGYELTIFDVKGGFLKTKNKVLMCAIPTKDYYKLKEGVKVIDPHAFISITDSYEVINPNRTLSAHRKQKSQLKE